MNKLDVVNGKVAYMYCAGNDMVTAVMPKEQAEAFDLTDSDLVKGYGLQSGNFFFKTKDDNNAGRSIKRRRFSNNQ